MTNIIITLGTKADPINVDVTKLGLDEGTWQASAPLRYVVEYGLKQSLNDAIAAVKVDAPDYSRANAGALVEKRLNAILTGSVKQAGTREASDPVMAEARKLAKAAFNAKPEQVRKTAMLAALKANLATDDKSAIAAIVEQLAPRFRDEAEKVIAARKAAVADVGDLTDMLAGLFAPTEE